LSRRDQRTVCCAAQASGRPCAVLDHACSAAQTERSSRASIGTWPQERRASVWGSAAGVALRLRFAKPPSPPALHFSARRPQTEAKEPKPRSIRKCASGEFSFFPPPILQAASHSADCSDSAMKARLIVWRQRARQGYYGSVRLDAPASVPPLTRPSPPGSFASRFSSREAVAVQLWETHPRMLR
jgi:hypothetical protein